jgi:DNA invertase Pin-like site-specific DNA recombinase
LSEWPRLFTISYFKGLHHADWLCTGLYGDQNLDLQKNALIRAECELVFEDGQREECQRPGLKRALRRLRAGDVLVVWKLDRLGRSVRDLITLVSELQARG